MVSALDHGLLVGDGVFETCKVRDGVAFALTRHLRRMERSARILGLSYPGDQAVRDAVGAVLQAAGPMPLGRLRVTLTGGVGPLGSERGERGPTLTVAAAPSAPWPSEIRVVTVPWRRNEYSAVRGAKTTSYAENAVALAHAQRKGAHEALLLNTNGDLCEGTGSNVVLVLGGRLRTPPLSSGCLGGITRELLIEWAEGEGIPVSEEALTLRHLEQAEDILLTSSTRDVQHVNDLDGRVVSRTELGERVQKLFDRRAGDMVDP